jgi:AraC-like DNA-binding protein
VWGELDGRELYRLGKAGAADVILSRDADDAHLVAEILQTTLDQGLAPLVDTRLRGRVADEARTLVRYASERVPSHIQVPELALAYDISVSTLERRCERWGLPTPGRLLLWLRVLYGLRWLLEPGRSVESVADQLGYSSGAAFRRAIKATIGGRPAPLRNRRAFHRALDQFIAECPGDGTVQRLAALV